ncbi:hypothetical protein MHC_03670 [Mycoplasma haemocanis str. Illinois]|uniref:Uncharacterized protein n=1 Tax=Mycoplasma haemocanis (strain Illinois) TaxID=1111676 RepID=H6N7H2_MYCHN|nr:hypothetical protein [Mycoplasma haemocanis]AEW45594.1 hypothetical protein MHC_03670 [Mycoplasma haemocanis str. Illinois]
MSKLLALSATGAGTIGIGGFGAYSFKTSSNNIRYIKDRLEESQYTLLSLNENKHKSYWNKSLQEYKKKHPFDSPLHVEDLKAICKQAFLGEYQDDDSYAKARRYCVVPRKISERIKDLGLNLLDMKGKLDEREWQWLSFEYSYIGEGNRKLGTLDKNSTKDYRNNWTLLRNECQKELMKDHWTPNYYFILKSVQRWCVALPN